MPPASDVLLALNEEEAAFTFIIGMILRARRADLGISDAAAPLGFSERERGEKKKKTLSQRTNPKSDKISRRFRRKSTAGDNLNAVAKH